jgi:tRNA (cmo5U34)-methyltransferase
MDDSPDLSVHEYFNSDKSTRYDREIRMSIPGYEAIHGMVDAFLSDTLACDAHLLIAGVGTGMELVTLGKRHPQWHFIAFDQSPEMLSVCRNNVASMGMTGRVTLVGGTTGALPEDLRCDAATSILVSQFISDGTERRHYFNSLARRIVPGGLFFAVDLVGNRSQPSFEKFGKAWRTFNIYNGRDPDELDESFRRSGQVVSFIPEVDYCRMLEETGFEDISQFYRGLLFCGWVCRRV